MNLGNLKLTTYMSTEPVFKVLNRSTHDYDTKEIASKLRIMYEGFMSGVRYATPFGGSSDFTSITNEITELMDHALYCDMHITNYSLKIAPVNDIDNLEESFELHPGILLILNGAYVHVKCSGSDDFLKAIPIQAIGDLEQALSTHLEIDVNDVYNEAAKLPDFYNIGKYTVKVVQDASFDNTYTVIIKEGDDTEENANEQENDE